MSDGAALALHLGLEGLGPGEFEEALGPAEGSRRPGGELSGELSGFIEDLAVGDDAGDDAPIGGLLGGEQAVGEGELEGALGANDAGEGIGGGVVQISI